MGHSQGSRRRGCDAARPPSRNAEFRGCFAEHRNRRASCSCMSVCALVSEAVAVRYIQGCVVGDSQGSLPARSAASTPLDSKWLGRTSAPAPKTHPRSTRAPVRASELHQHTHHYRGVLPRSPRTHSTRQCEPKLRALRTTCRHTSLVPDSECVDGPHRAAFVRGKGEGGSKGWEGQHLRHQQRCPVTRELR